MYSPLPDTWDQLIRAGAQPKTVLDIYFDPSVSIVTLGDIPVESFSVTVDRKSSIRRSASVKLVDFQILAELKSGNSSLEPYGSEMRIRSGFVYPDGTQDLIPLGYFQIEDLSWNEDETSLEIKAFDRSQALQRSSFGIALDASGKGCIDFIQDTIQDLLPYVSFVSEISAENDIRLPGGTSYQGGRLTAVQDAAAALGAEFFFDANGVARIVPVPFLDQVTDPSDHDWVLNTGSDGVIISYQRSITRKDTFNKIHVLGAPGNNKSPQPYASAQDDNPTSVTYYGGRFGKAEQKIERQELVTDSQCRTYALAVLRNSIGLSKSLDVASLQNVALDAGDKILVQFPDGTEELHLVDTLTFNETFGMKVGTRTQQGQS